MQALRFHGPKPVKLILDQIPKPELKANQVLIKVGYCGICGSDLHEYRIGPKNLPITPHILTGETLPTVCGHEFSGTVVEVAPGINDLKAGDKAAIFPILTCGECHWCKTESYGLCPKWGFMGYSGGGGGFSEYMAVDRKAVHLVPENVPLDVAALVEPLAVGWHAVKLAQTHAKNIPGAELERGTCLVLGSGPIGLATIHSLVAHGVSQIIVSEPSPVRAQQARKAGATEVVNPTQVDVAKFAREKSEDGFGAHAVFECAGLQVAFDTAMASVRGRGIVVNVAIYETELSWKNPNGLNRHQITITGSNTYTRIEFQEVIDAIAAGRIKNPETMITARVPLSNALKEGFEVLLNSTNEHIKILVGAGD